MVLQDLRTIDLGDSVRFSVRVSYENITLKDFELYYEVDKKYSQYLANSYEAFVSAVIIPTMGVPEDIYVKGGIDQKFLENMDKVMRLIVPWKVSDSWHKKINKIKIHPDHIIQSTQARTEKSAMFFSSGVDSF